MTIVTEPEQAVTTPTIGRLLRGSRFWLILAGVIVLAIVGYNILTPAAIDAKPLSADGTGETGAGALVAVLKQHGVSVTATSTIDATAGAISSAGSTTVFVYDPSDYLDGAQRTRLAGLAAHVVVLAPSAAALRSFAPGITPAGTAPSTLTAHCVAAAAVKAGTITDGGQAYRVNDAGDVVHSCFPSGAGAYSMVQLRSATTHVTVVGTTNAFTNEYISDRGNAALAINLLGSTSQLVWYLPSIADVGASGHTESITTAAPHWIVPLTLLVLFVVIAAGVWRGRRFGPVVVERLPVIVRASETMEGRARLYQASSARLRALDALRVGAIQRVAVLCGLPRRASLDEVIGAAAAATGREAHAVRALLLDTTPRSDAELVRLSDDLLVFEREVATATRPS